MSNGEILARVKATLKGNFWRAVLIAMIVGALPVLLDFILSSLGLGGSAMSLFSSNNVTVSQAVVPFLIQALVSFVVWMLATILVVGEKWSYLEMVDSGDLEIKRVFESFAKRPGRNIWHNILQAIFIFLWTVVGYFILGLLFGLINWFTISSADIGTWAMVAIGIISFIVFIITAVIWPLIVNLWYILSEYVLYDDFNLSASQALKASKHLMKRNKWALFTLGVRIYLPLILLSIALPIVIIALFFIIQEQYWIVAVLAFLVIIGLMIYSILVGIRWKAALAVFYRQAYDFD